MSWQTLFPQHAEMLRASGITEAQADARGYRSIDTKKRLDDLNVTKAARKVPGLLVPMLRDDGSVWGYQYRPDEPRLRDGKPVKYETPVGQRNGIDVPPGVAERLGDPTYPLWVTEGVKKADCGAVHGLCIVALAGVWNWRGSNEHGGKVAVPDWHDIALNGRRVILAFDGDVARKKAVRSALDALAAYLAGKGAHVEFLHLPDEDDKVGLDDYLNADHTVDDLLKLVRPEPPSLAPDEPVAPVHQGGGPVRTETGQLIGEVRAWLARFVTTLHEHDLDLLTLWAAHTHLAFETYTTPRLVLDSPVHGSGKTTCLEHLQRLALRPVQAASLSSPALLTRMLDAGPRTILIDEADRSLDPKKEGIGDLLAILNSGYKRGGSRPTLVPDKENGWRTVEMPTFAPVAMAGNNPQLPDDTRSRCIRVLLMPDVDGNAEESDWELIEPDALELGQRLAAWAEGVRDEVRTTRPELPEGVRGRNAEKWRPLARIAAAAGGRWLGVVDELAVADLERQAADREDNMSNQRPHILLLSHLGEVWPEGASFASTQELVSGLVQAHPETWGAFSSYGRDLTAQRFGRMLATFYGVNSTRLERGGARGYTYASLARAWHCLGLSAPAAPDGATPSSEPVHPVQAAEPVRPTCGTCGTVLHHGTCVRCQVSAS